MSAYYLVTADDNRSLSTQFMEHIYKNALVIVPQHEKICLLKLTTR